MNLFKMEPEEWFHRPIKGYLDIALPMLQMDLTGNSYNNETIDSLIEERNAARAAKNWKRADEIRDELLKAGIELLDGSEGTKWRRKE